MTAVMNEIDDDVTDSAASRKAFTHAAAVAALNGWQLWRSDASDGVQRFFIGRWGQVRVLASLDEIDRFFTQAGIR